jgi:uncharacterized LabA/DUF88 family protein
MATRVGLFVDGNNVFYMQKEQGWWINWRKLRSYFGEHQGNEITECFYFTGMPHYSDAEQIEKQRAFNKRLTQMGYTVVPKELKVVGTTPGGEEIRKANLDIEMTLRIMQGMPHYDQAVLVEGDGDFTCLVDYLRANGKNVLVVAMPNRLATELRNAAHRTVLLKDIRAEVEDTYVKKQPNN